MLGFKAFRSAYTTLAGIEVVHMIKNGQMILDTGLTMTRAARFYSLAGSSKVSEELLGLSCENAM